MGDPIKQDDGTFRNDANAVVNAEGGLIDDDGALINEEGFLINAAGQLLNEDGEAVDSTGARIGEDGKLLAPATGDTMIPKHRYDSAARRANAAEEEARTLREELASRGDTPAEPANGEPKTVQELEAKIDALDIAIEDARKDGDASKVVQLNKEQRTYERSMYAQVAHDEATGAGTAAQQAAALDVLVDKLEQDYPVFNQDSKEFDQALTNEVLDMHEAFVAKGEAPAVAMAKAVGYIMPKNTGTAGRGTDNKKNLDAAGRQAPDIGSTGAGSDTAGDAGDAASIGAMTSKEFDALPNDTKKRLRGDSM